MGKKVVKKVVKKPVAKSNIKKAPIKKKVVKKVIKKALPKPKPKKVVRKPTSTRKPGSGGKRPTVIRNKLTRDIDPAFSPEQIGKALGLLGQVKDGRRPGHPDGGHYRRRRLARPRPPLHDLLWILRRP